ncbi:g537 [Coccomyxa elongata]
MLSVLNAALRLSGSDLAVPSSRLAIGTVSPTQQLHIVQPDVTLQSGILIQGPDGAKYTLGYSGTGLALTEGGSMSRLMFANGGSYLGVGTPNPLAGLHVGNDLRVDGNLIVMGSLTHLYTNSTTTNQFEIDNAGTGAAVTVRQAGQQPAMLVYNGSTMVLGVSGSGLAMYSNLQQTGPPSSILGPHSSAYTTADNYPLYQGLNWQHDNVSMNFDAYYDGTAWRTSHTSTAFQVMKLNSNLLIRPSLGTSTAGGTASFGVAGLTVNSLGQLGINTAPAHALDVGGDVNTSGSLTVAGPASFTTSVVTPSLVTRGLTVTSATITTLTAAVANVTATLTASALNAMGFSSLTGGVQASSLSVGGPMVVASTTSLLGSLTVTGPASMTSVTTPSLMATGATVTSLTATIASVTGNLSATSLIATGFSSLTGAALVSGSLSLNGPLLITGSASISGSLSVAGPASFASTLTAPVLSAGTLSSTNASLTSLLAGTATVSGLQVAVASVTGSLLALNYTSLSSAIVGGSLTVAGGASVSGQLVTSTLLSTGPATISGSLSANAGLQVQSVQVVDGSGTIRANVSTASLTGTALTVFGSGSIASLVIGTDLTVARNISASGVVGNNVFGSLLLRGYDESFTYANTVATVGQPLPAAFLSRAIVQQQVATLSFTNLALGSLTYGYSARISGCVNPPSTGTYTMRLTYKDGASLWIGTHRLVSSWTFAGSATATVGSPITLYQNMWQPILLEHACGSATERLLLEYSTNGGASYTTMAHATDGSNFMFAYDLYENAPSVQGTTYFCGKPVFNDLALFTAGESLPNASLFTGKTSELLNDAAFITNSDTGTLTASALGVQNATITGTLSTTYLACQNANIAGTLTTAVLGVNQPNPAFTLDVGGNINFSGSLYKGSLPYVSSQWTTAGSSLYIQGTNVGINTSTPQNPLDVAGNISSSGIISNNVVGSLVLRVFNDSGVYAATTLTAGQPLPAPFLTRPVLDQQVGTVSLSMATFGTNVSAYSARLAGYIMPPATGTYLFRVTGQDGLTLYVSTLKLTDSWLYSGSATQQIGTITMTSGIWSPFLVEHSASSTLTERLLVEWSSNRGTTYQTLTHGTTSGSFRFAYDMKEVPQSLQGTQYIAGKQFCNDLVTMSAGASLPNASFFSGKISELVNDASLTSGGSGVATSVVGSLLMRVFDETGVYSLSTLTVGQPLPAPFLSRPVLDQTLGMVSLSAATFGTSVAAYSARIGGYIQAPQTGTYSFRVTYEDGATLYVTDQKVLDSWIYTGTISQAIGSLTLLAGVWCPFLLEHTSSGTSTERLLVEYSINAGSYSTLANGTTSGQFRMAYNLSEFPETLLGTSYTVGKSNFSDLVTMTAGASLPNASVFTGRTSELTNDAGFGAGGSGGSVANNVVGSLLMRVFDDSVVYADTTLVVGGPLPAPFLSRPVQDVPVGTLSLSSALYGTNVSAFSARICGYINPPTTGTFLFRTTYEDGATLYVASQKLVDSWTYAGSQLQTVGTITLTQGVWSSFVLEHTAAGTATEKLLVECSSNAGTLYSTLAHGTASGMFQFAYNLQEFPAAQLGTSYAYGRVYFGDTARMAAGMILPNANYFSGNTSELNNDGGYVKTLGVVSAPISALYTLTGTVSVATGGGSVTSWGVNSSASQNYTGMLNSSGQVVIPSTGIYSLRFQADFASVTGTNPVMSSWFTSSTTYPGKVGLQATPVAFGCEPITESAFTGNFQGGELVTVYAAGTYSGSGSAYLNTANTLLSVTNSGKLLQVNGTLTAGSGTVTAYAAVLGTTGSQLTIGPTGNLVTAGTLSSAMIVATNASINASVTTGTLSCFAASVSGSLSAAVASFAGIMVPKVQYGSSSLSSGTRTITFATAFSSVPYVFLQGLVATSTLIYYWQCSNTSPSGFTASATYSSGSGNGVASADPFNWVAIGM